MKTVLVAGVLIISSATGCIRPPQDGGAGSGGSKLVSVKMKMPTKIGDKDITGKMDGYRLVIKKTGGECVFSDIDRTEKVSVQDVKIDASLKQGCDYSLLLSFGKASVDGKTLDQIFLSSDAFDSKAAAPTLIKREEIKGKTALTVKACVSVTSLGAKELGVSTMECPSVSDDSVDATVEPFIPQQSGSFRLSKPVSYTYQNNGREILVTADLEAKLATVMHCALAIDVKFRSSMVKRPMVNDTISEVKAGDRKTVSQVITIANDMGPDEVTDVNIIESCSVTKPDTATTAQALIEQCVMANNCVKITQ